MFYLQRSGSPDQEGPYSYEYLLRMAKEGRLFSDDLIVPAEGGASFHAGENLEFGQLKPAPQPQTVIPGTVTENPAYIPPSTPTPPPSNTKISSGTIAVIAAVAILSLCCIPGFLVFRGGAQAAGGEMSGVQSIDAVTAINRITRATINYCNDNDGFFPSGMDSGKWKEQLQPYLEPGTPFEIAPGMPIEPNPNLSIIRQGSIIDPRQTLMFFIRKPVLGNQSAVSNVDGQSGYVDSEGLERSIRRDIYNVPFNSGYQRRGR